MHVPPHHVTKYRRNVLDDAMLRRREDIMIEVCDRFEAELREFNGEDDHVHLLVHHPPKVVNSRLVNSSRETPPTTCARSSPAASTGPSCTATFWSPSYLAASCGGAPRPIIRQYIEQQRQPA